LATAISPWKMATTEYARDDGRELGATRPLLASVGFSSQATGSARVEIGKTKVACAVYGPSSSSRDMDEFSELCKIVCDFKYAPFACKGERRKRGRGLDEDELSSVVEQAVRSSVCTELYPKSVINIYILVLEDEGNAVGAAITAASMAIAQARISCVDMVVASSVCKIEGSTSAGLVADPSSEERRVCNATTFVAYMPNVEKITSMISQGKLSSKETVNMLNLGVSSCKDLHAQARSFLLASAP
jgi:exosome complex component MTR3